MFTGLIGATGKIADIEILRNERRFKIIPDPEFTNLQDGESIAVDGVCLSVEKHSKSAFTAYASAETVSRTNLAALDNNSLVNLERALVLGSRLDGHLVSGHIDCLAVLQTRQIAGQSLKMRLSFPAKYGTEVIPKGSVALNGISLTVNECGMDFLEINIIPDSQKRTNIGLWRIGTKINMETDLIGKYVISACKNRFDNLKSSSALTKEYLGRFGFL